MISRLDGVGKRSSNCKLDHQKAFEASDYVGMKMTISPFLAFSEIFPRERSELNRRLCLPKKIAVHKIVNLLFTLVASHMVAFQPVSICPIAMDESRFVGEGQENFGY